MYSTNQLKQTFALICFLLIKWWKRISPSLEISSTIRFLVNLYLFAVHVIMIALQMISEG